MDKPLNPFLGYGIVLGAIMAVVLTAYVRNRLWVRQMERELRAESGDFKTVAHRIVDSLPEDAGWDDLMYEVYLRQEIEEGVADNRASRMISQDEAIARARARIRQAT